ncbi:MAG: VOC family protein [Chloroflexi bacterium]|nr:VOC family protein [Chloroflexota bacterium]
MTLGKIGQIAINGIKNLDTAVDFYRETLGIPFIGIFNPPGLAFFDCDGTRLMLTTEGKPNNSTIYFQVDDVHATYKSLKAARVPMEGEPHAVFTTDNYELWMAFFHDPDGNLHAVQEERGRFAP